MSGRNLLALIFLLVEKIERFHNQSKNVGGGHVPASYTWEVGTCALATQTTPGVKYRLSVFSNFFNLSLLFFDSVHRRPLLLKNCAVLLTVMSSSQMCANKLQSRTKCTNSTCVDFIRLFAKYFGDDNVSTHAKSYQTCDRKLKEAAGVEVLELHGYIKCDRHVFLPSSTETLCPNCGACRYDARGKPNEVCLC